MVHTITEIKEGDQILYKNIECNDNNEIVITMKIIKGNQPKMREVIYITSYNKKEEQLQKEVLHEYSRECTICNSKENITITPILPENIYTELINETWNNIPLCENCKNMLEKHNNKDPNGIKNLVKLIKQEDKKHINWLKSLK